MPTGECRTRRMLPAAGFTYLLLLFAVAASAAGLAALGSAWATAVQRGKEAELMFRGAEFSRAFDSYLRSTPAGASPFPRDLDELLDDRRGLQPQRHLRRVYTDPFTGAADWLPVLDGERLRAVRSRSSARLFRLPHGASPNATVRVSDLEFSAAETPFASAIPLSSNRLEAEPRSASQ